MEETLGSCEQMERIHADIARVAPTDFTVLILGETGSGKEVVARAIHRVSPRAKGPFVPVDCGSIPESLMEGELFGHEKGSFTGADRRRPGKFEIASGGTLFLDEISNLPTHVQPKLLRALQEKQVWRIGGTRAIDVDIRVIAATNVDLASLIQSGDFRRDLYHRLDEFSVVVPPLRERRGDIVLLAERFLEITGRELKKAVQGFSEDAVALLLNYRWPGNVRELRNVVRRAALLADTVIEAHHLALSDGLVPPSLDRPRLDEPVERDLPLKEAVRRVVVRAERRILTGILQQTGGNKAQVARILQIDYKTVCKKIRDYGICQA
jgi:two-component system nitrogen regulation response regulator GlnG